MNGIGYQCIIRLFFFLLVFTFELDTGNFLPAFSFLFFFFGSPMSYSFHFYILRLFNFHSFSPYLFSILFELSIFSTSSSILLTFPRCFLFLTLFISTFSAFSTLSFFFSLSAFPAYLFSILFAFSIFSTSSSILLAFPCFFL